MTYESDALRFANRVIKDLDGTPQASLPPGIPEDACECPVARAISAGVPAYRFVVGEVGHLWVEGYDESLHDVRTWQTPKGASRFINRFDERKYPELIA